MKTRRLLLLCAALAGVLVAFSTASFAKGSDSARAGDWVHLLPIFAPLAATALAMAIVFARRCSGPMAGALWGAFAGASLLLMYQAIQLLLQGDLIRSDGTAYWVLLTMPAVIGGAILIPLAAAAGLAVGFMIRRRKQAATVCD